MEGVLGLGLVGENRFFYRITGLRCMAEFFYRLGYPYPSVLQSWLVDFVHAAARASARFSAPLRLVGSPRLAHIKFWTALQASCFPSTLASCLTEFSLSFCPIISSFVL